MENVFVMDVMGASPSEIKEKVYVSVSTSTLSPIFPFCRYALATYATLASLQALPDLDLL